MDLGFTVPESEAEREIEALIDQIAAADATRLEQEVFAQRKRFADAERKLATKVTKAATESKRIATDKVDRAMARLADLKRTELRDRDSQIYPGYYAPVMVMEGGRLVVKPMCCCALKIDRSIFGRPQHPRLHRFRFLRGMESINISKKYSREIRERAVTLVFAHKAEHGLKWVPIGSIAPKSGCMAKTLRTWVRQGSARPRAAFVHTKRGPFYFERSGGKRF